MGTILKGVNRIPWRRLTHAYGTAEAVPGRLSRVAWGDAATSASALADLGLWLAELSVFDATVEAVPFFWDLAVTESVNGRGEVIHLLRTVLEQANPPRLDVQYAAHRAVLEGRARADRLTGDGDPSVRAAARDLVAAMDAHGCGPGCAA